MLHLSASECVYAFLTRTCAYVHATFLWSRNGSETAIYGLLEKLVHRLSFEQTQRNERIGEKTLSYLRLYHAAWTVSGIDDVLPVEVGKGVKETHPII